MRHGSRPPLSVAAILRARLGNFFLSRPGCKPFVWGFSIESAGTSRRMFFSLLAERQLAAFFEASLQPLAPSFCRASPLELSA